MVQQLSASKDRLDREMLRIKSHPYVSGPLLVITFAYATWAWFTGDSPWAVIVKLWNRALTMTSAELWTSGALLVAVVAAYGLVAGYYDRRVEALEARNKLRDAESRNVALNQTISTTENDLTQLKHQVTKLQEASNGNSYVVSDLQHELAEVQHRNARYQIQLLVRVAKDNGWQPNVTLVFVESADAAVVDAIAEALKKHAPTWPVKKVRDSGSTLRQPEELPGPRVILKGSNEHIVGPLATCFQWSKWIDEPVQWTLAEGEDVVITVYPKTAKVA